MYYEYTYSGVRRPFCAWSERLRSSRVLALTRLLAVPPSCAPSPPPPCNTVPPSPSPTHTECVCGVHSQPLQWRLHKLGHIFSLGFS